MRNKILLAIFSIFLISFASAANYNITNCQDITLPGTYLITQDLSSSATCLNILASNVFINGNSKTIVGLGSNDKQGIDIFNQSNIYIQNLNIRGFGTGISGIDLNNLNLESINIQNTTIGLYLANSQNTYLNDMTYSNNALINEFTEDNNNTFTNVPLVPEFGFYIGALTLVSAVGIFFFLRKK